MATNFLVEVLSKTPFQDIDGSPYCVWCYRVSWTAPARELKERVGLIFSSRLDIKDPAFYPGVQAIQATRVAKTAGDDKQYVFESIDRSSVSRVDLCFLAPCIEDSFTPVQLGTETEEVGQTQLLPFSMQVEGAASLTQTMRGPAFVCPPKIQPADARPLSNSSRRVPKVTLVSLRPDPQPSDTGGAVPKFSFLNQLRLQPGEAEAARNKLIGAGGKPRFQPLDVEVTRLKLLSTGSQLWDTLKAFEGSSIPSQLPSPSAFASVPTDTLKAFGKAIVEIRQEALNHLKQQQLAEFSDGALTQTPIKSEIGSALNMLNAAAVASNAFEAAFQVTPIGFLNLERIEMTPVGIERGELIATIPLAPLEKTAVVHKEWSVTTKEFTSIVTDSLENYSETGVTENTELAQSTTSQTAHSNQFNVNGTVTGSYGPVTATVSSGFTAQDSGSDTANESRKHAISTTRKASSRVKQEHKVTISTTTVTGTSETSTRVLENSSPTDPIRIDYFSMMRKWHVGLYRYGLRFTYDITVPEPGATLRKAYAELDALKKQIGPFKFSIPYSEITTDVWLPNESEPHYLVLAERYSAQVPSPPAPGPTLTPNASFTVTPGIHQFQLAFDVPAGYSITSVTLDAHVTGPANIFFDFEVLGTTFQKIRQPDQTFPSTLLISRKDGSKFLEHGEGPKTVTFHFFDATSAMVELTIETKLTDQLIQQWQQGVWNALYNAARGSSRCPRLINI